MLYLKLYIKDVRNTYDKEVIYIVLDVNEEGYCEILGFYVRSRNQMVD